MWLCYRIIACPTSRIRFTRTVGGLPRITGIPTSINTTGEKLFPPYLYRVYLRAALPLKKGDELFAAYTYSMWPTIIRREYLREGKYFECNCQRCADPTELGTHMSTLKCTKNLCDNGVILSTNSLGKLASSYKIYS